VVRGEIHSGQTVIIANGLIEADGPSGSVDIPAAAVRIPGDGRYLMPGLWDMHVHLRSDEKAPTIRLVEENAALLDLFLPNGIVGIRKRHARRSREMGGDLADEVVHWREEIRSGKRAGPRKAEWMGWSMRCISRRRTGTNSKGLYANTTGGGTPHWRWMRSKLAQGSWPWRTTNKAKSFIVGWRKNNSG
jgi:hypothetical protein